MENYSHQSYPDSGDSFPLSREIDGENPSSWDEAPAGAGAGATTYKMNFMCSYGGKIQPRPHDNQLSYVGGDTKILSVDRNANFSTVVAKLASLCDAAPSEICLKYQLPGENLDALITVTNDEDLEHMMLEYDRLNRSSPKPARLRIFLFPVASKPSSEEYGFKEAKLEGSWFVDALNSAHLRPLDDSSPPPPANPEPANPVFMFGPDKAMNYKVGNPNPNTANSNPDLKDQVAVGQPIASIQNQMERFRIGEGEMQKSYEDLNPNVNTSRIYQSDYYKVQEKASPAPPQAAPVPISAGYWPERQVQASASNYPVASEIPADHQPVYVIQTPAGGVYHQTPPVRPVTAAPPGAGQGYYSVPRVMPEAYREQPTYNAVPPPPPSLIQQPKVTGVHEGIGMVRQPPLAPAPAMMTEHAYTQVSYDSTGRPVYYTVAGGGLAPPPYQVMTTAAATVVDGRTVGGVGLGHDSKVVGGKPPQTSSV